MTSFRNLLTKPSRPIPKRWALGILLAAIVGLVDAAYLTVQHYVGGAVPCVVVKGCDTVLSSPYAALLGLPVSLYGMVFYLAALVGAIAYLDSRKIFWMGWLGILALAGLLVTLGLLYLQIFVIKALCLYCLLSAGSSISIFVLLMLGPLAIDKNN